MPNGIVYFPLVAVIATVVLLVVTRRKKPAQGDKP